MRISKSSYLAVVCLVSAASVTLVDAQSIRMPSTRISARTKSAPSAPTPPPGQTTPAITTSPAPSIIPPFAAQCAPQPKFGWVAGQPFAPLIVSGGTPPYTYSLSSPSSLPSGTTLDTKTGEINAFGPEILNNIKYKVTDQNGASQQPTCSSSISMNAPGALALFCPGAAKTGLAFQIVNIYGGQPPFKYEATNLPRNLTLDSNTGIVSGASTPGYLPNITVTVTDNAATEQSITCALAVEAYQPRCWFFPASSSSCVGNGDQRSANVNAFFGTESSYSFFDQIGATYNGSSSSATTEADLASLNFSIGVEVTAGTNIQVGPSNTTTAATTIPPTLSASAAAQAAQNMLYGGTVFARSQWPFLFIHTGSLQSPGGFLITANLVAQEGADIQNFKAGTSTTVSSPPSHFTGQMQGYAQYNSSNLSAGSSTSAGAVFIGGSYGYSHISSDYEGNYGFSRQDNAIGQFSGGILINGTAKLTLSRGFGPKQTYSSTTGAPTTADNFSAWSFGITYQTPPAKK